MSKGPSIRERLAFYRDIAWRMILSLKSAIFAFEGVVAIAIFSASLLSDKWEAIPGWIKPQWAFIPLALLCAVLFLRAVHDKWCEREAEFAGQLKSLTNHRPGVDLDSAKWQAVHNAALDRLTHVRQALREHADAAPLCYSFTPKDVETWVQGAVHLLNGTVNLSFARQFCSVSASPSEYEVIASANSLKTIAAILTVEGLRDAGNTVESNVLTSQTPADTKRLEDVKKRLQSIVRTIDIPRTPSPLTEVYSALGAVANIHGREKTDWRAETKGELRALINDTLYEKYEGCFRQKEPALAARAFLNGLVINLKASDLR